MKNLKKGAILSRKYMLNTMEGKTADLKCYLPWSPKFLTQCSQLCAFLTLFSSDILVTTITFLKWTHFLKVFSPKWNVCFNPSPESSRVYMEEGAQTL